jgi:hypothetical protein
VLSTLLSYTMQQKKNAAFSKVKTQHFVFRSLKRQRRNFALEGKPPLETTNLERGDREHPSKHLSCLQGINSLLLSGSVERRDEQSQS